MNSLLFSIGQCKNLILTNKIVIRMILLILTYLGITQYSFLKLKLYTKENITMKRIIFRKYYTTILENVQVFYLIVSDNNVRKTKTKKSIIACKNLKRKIISKMNI